MDGRWFIAATAAAGVLVGTRPVLYVQFVPVSVLA